MSRLVILFLLLSTCVQAGQVKTYDGMKIEKDSAAELRLYFEEKTSQKNKVFAASIIKIDDTEFQDNTRRVADYSSTHPYARENPLDWLESNFNAARKLKKVYLQDREHRISIRGRILLTEKKARKTDYTDWVVLKFTPTAGTSYEVRARTDETNWVFWIADRRTGEVVSSVDYKK